MIEFWIVLGVLFWIGCGVVAYGQSFAYFQRKYPQLAEWDRAEDQRNAVLKGLWGPIGLVLNRMAGFRGHGFKWRATDD